MGGNSVQPGKVIKSTRNHYLVQTSDGIKKCVVRGKIAGAMTEEISAVKVGDNVIIRMFGEQEGVIQKILPRKSKLSRMVEGKAYREQIVATNIDQMIIIMSVKFPEFKSGLLDRYLVIAEKNRLKSVICLNKADLALPGQFADYAACYRKLKYPFYFTSVPTGQGLPAFKKVIKDKVSVLVGHSGVGKSSLIQKIEPTLQLKIAQISDKSKKGKHTTSHAELFPLSFGGFLIDTPGIRELGLWDIYQDQLKSFFAEFRKYNARCQFSNCLHLKEPGCAVKEAVEAGKIYDNRYKNYCAIYNDLRAVPYELLKRR